MIEGKSILGLITARGGSKGLPRKNVLPLAGKPLIAWTIESAQASKYLDRIVLSSDDDEIMEVAKAYGCEVPFRRPARLAADDTPGIDPVLHALDQLEDFDYVVLLQPTSPLRTAEDIDGAIRKCVEDHAPSCVSVVEVGKPAHWMFTISEKQCLMPILDGGDDEVLRRQMAPSIYVLNGAVYVAEVRHVREVKRFLVKETLAYIMPKSRSVDIDTSLELQWCDILLSSYVAQ